MSGLAQWGKNKSLALLDGVKEKLPWPWVKKGLTFAFFAFVIYLLSQQATQIEWSKVASTVTDYSPWVFVRAIALALACYGVYAAYDLIGRYLLGIKLSVLKTWFVSGLSYAFNLNLGALVGGVAFRYRLYSRFGISAADVTKIIGISVASNWLGYLLLAGVLFVSGSVETPKQWSLSSGALQALGAVFLVVVLCYLYLCWRHPGKQLEVKSLRLKLPELRPACVQLTLACAHWCLMALVVYQFFVGELDFTQVFAALLVSAVAGAATHIPGGLGVLEAVFIALLSSSLDKSAILAGLFGYRIAFYLFPLAMAVPIYLGFESYHAKRK